jgi:hypothetical protein
MTITHGYATLAEVRAWLDFPATDTAHDSEIESVIEVCSRWIDKFTGRQFYVSTGARYYTADETGVDVDDLLGVSTMATDDTGDRTYTTTWADTDYDLLPFNASADGQPYTRIEPSVNGVYMFPEGLVKGVKIEGTWGYCATTTNHSVNIACRIQAQRIWKRRDAPFGVEGADKSGILAESSLDQDVKLILAPYVRYV